MTVDERTPHPESSVPRTESGELDVERIMDDIRAAVARKTAAGAYRDLRIARAERFNLGHLRDDESLLQFYLDCLRGAATVDINDFEIIERRRCARLLVWLKRGIWNLLRFYTYRLWSQQNQVNGLLVTAIEGLEDKYRRRLTELENRLKALETGKSCPPPDA